MKQKKEDNAICQYEFGFGSVNIYAAVADFKYKKGEPLRLPFVEIGMLKDSREIGEETSGEDVFNVTRIVFTNTESMDVLQRALDFCRGALAAKETTDES